MHVLLARLPQRFKMLCCTGSRAYEIQAGPLVIQWFYERFEHARLFGRLHIWRDPHWRA